MPRVQPDVFERAISLANKSTMQHRHGAVIVKNGQIIGEGFNYETHFMCHQWSIHSEVAAIMSIKRQHRNKKFLEDAVMLVVRIGARNWNSDCRLSKPCEKCRQAINESGIKKVFYSC
jgi:deoxycytidylate deaminase